MVKYYSTEDTEVMLARHADRILLKEKLGHCNARNCAIDGGSGGFIIWTDDDVLLDQQ